MLYLCIIKEGGGDCGTKSKTVKFAKILIRLSVRLGQQCIVHFQTE